MSDLYCYSFDRLLSKNEIDFWGKFFNEFPIDYTPYFRSAITEFEKEPDELYRYFEKTRYLKNTKDLIGMFNSDNFTDVAKEAFDEITKKMDDIFPNSTPTDILLATLYIGYITEWDLKFESKGIYFDVNKKLIDQSTIPSLCLQLSLVIDFMSKMTNKIFYNVNLEPIKFSGKQIISETNLRYTNITYSENGVILHKKRAKPRVNYKIEVTSFGVELLEFYEDSTVQIKKDYDFLPTPYDYRVNNFHVHLEKIKYKNILLQLIELNYFSNTLQKKNECNTKKTVTKI